MSAERSSEVEAIVERVDPDRPIESIESFWTYDGHRVCEVEFQDGDESWIATVATGTEEQERVEIDHAVQRYLHSETDVSVPPVVARGSPSGDTPAFFVSERPDGKWVDAKYGRLSKDERTDLVYDLGVELGRLHEQTDFESVGRFKTGDEGDLVVSEAPSWGDVVENVVTRKRSGLRGSRFEQSANRIAKYFRDHRETVESTDAPALLHTDYRRQTVFHDADSVSGIVGWGRVLAGDPTFDLCAAETWILDNDDHFATDDLRDALFAGYRSVDGLADDFYERRQVYRVVLYLFPLSSFDSWITDSEVDPETMANRMRQYLQILLQ